LPLVNATFDGRMWSVAIRFSSLWRVECGRVTSSVVARRCTILDKGRDCV
jgi:hypothetical protein